MTNDQVLYDSKEWKEYPLNRCYCLHAPSVAGCRIWRCNLCCNEIIDAKNELVRENNHLRDLLKEKGVDL